MKIFIIALLLAIGYAQTEDAAGEVSTGVSTGSTTGSTTGTTGETGDGETTDGESGTGSTTGEIPSTGATTGEIPSTGETSTGETTTGATSTGSTGMVLPCKMRMPNNCAGPSPMGGRCYMSEFTECEEAERGEENFMCKGLPMNDCNAKKGYCFFDMSDMECTSITDMEYPIMAGGAGGIAVPSLPQLIPGMPGGATGGSPQAVITAMTGCMKYSLTNLASCTPANGCYRDEEQCKPIAAKMTGMDAPEVEMEGPEGFIPGLMPQLPGTAPLSKAQEPQKQSQETSNKSNIPSELIYGSAGFFGGIFMSVVIYFLTCGRQKINSHRDVFLEEYSSRDFPVV